MSAVQDKLNDLEAGADAKLGTAQAKVETLSDAAASRLRTVGDRAKPALDDAKGHAAETIGYVKDSVAAGANALKNQTADLSQQASDYAKSAMDTAKDHAADLADRAQMAAGQIRDGLPTADDLRAVGERGRHHLARQVASQPLEALLLAGAVGYLAAWIIHRR
jgi:ElaB/YqjD/DUF883 family membrane-anchored ribosome-binding protein